MSLDLEVRYGYDCLDRVEEITYGNHVHTRYEYDGDGNVSFLETKAGEEILLSFRYEYDGNGNRVAKRGEQAAVDGNQRITAAYRYDIRGQLTEERDGDACTSYGYDSAGNRIWKKAPERETRYIYNEKNQLISEIWDQGKNTFTYDSQGSILEIAGTERSLQFGYDSRNRQTKVSSSDGRSQENLYDAEGLRCGVKENGKLSRFAYHQGELLYERSDEREVSYHLGGGIEAARMGSELYYYHQDEQLSTALLTDDAGRVRNYYRYDAFGGMLAGEEGVSNRLRYTGQQYDAISEQYYLRARYYNPVVGRFLQEDVYEGDGLNLYAYCKNNPVRYYDPSGYAYDESKIGGNGGEEYKENKIDDFMNGKRPFKEVVDDYAKIYSEKVNSNEAWSWGDSIPGGSELSKRQRAKIREQAIASGYIEKVTVKKSRNMRYGFADFKTAGLVEYEIDLPQELWKAKDSQQFQWLNKQIGGELPGYTWHHTEMPGQMQLVPTGIHNVYTHNGGRSPGMWADAPR